MSDDETPTTYGDAVGVRSDGDGTVADSPSEIVSDAPNVHLLTDNQLQVLVRHVAMASYRAARYRGQMNAESLEPIQRKMVSRKADEWFEQNKDEYV